MEDRRRVRKEDTPSAREKMGGRVSEESRGLAGRKMMKGKGNEVRMWNKGRGKCRKEEVEKLGRG